MFEKQIMQPWLHYFMRLAYLTNTSFILFHIHAGYFMILSHYLELCLMLLVYLFWLFKVACIKESLPDEQYHWSFLNTSSTTYLKTKGQLLEINLDVCF